jgi:hypothetical protein
MLIPSRKLLFLAFASAVLSGAPVAVVLVPQPVRQISDPRAILAETVSPAVIPSGPAARS